MLKSLDLDTLQEHKRMGRLAFLFKILKKPTHKDSVAVQPSYLEIIKSPHPCRTPKVHPPKATPKLVYTYIASMGELQEHFIARTVSDWNELFQS